MANKNLKPADDKVRAKGVKKRQEIAEIKEKLHEALSAKNITDLEKQVLENWEIMVNSDDLRLKALATKEVSKYLFAQKREHIVLPEIKFNVVFEGIKDGRDERKE